MNDEAQQSDSPEAAASRAIDEVLAAEKDAARAIAAAAEAAEELRREANESAHLILARAETRIRNLHGKVADDLRSEVAQLREASSGGNANAPAIQVDSTQLERLAAGLAEWLTTDADD